jgi:hypothetical protein
LYRSPESASQAHYLCNKIYYIFGELEHADCLAKYSDILHGSNLIGAFEDGCISKDDIVLMFSIDGAQLYAKKASACWIYIWVLLNLSPTEHYKKKQVLVSSVIPGPNNPKNLNSFLFPGLQYLVALQKEGLRIWDVVLQHKVKSKVFLALITADSPSIMHITGMVGYHGKHGCYLYCGMQGCCEYHRKHYFLALLRPDNYKVTDCTYEDIDMSNLLTPSHEQYYKNLCFLITSPNDSQYCT